MTDSGPTNSATQWTTRRLLAWTTDYFKKHHIDHPRLSGEMLLAHVLEVERLKLYMDPDRPTSELERAAYRELVEQAAKHKPVDYLVGQTPFFSMMLNVNETVLIPRPSTETVVEHVIQHAKRTPGFHSPVIADVGTGSGAIAISLAKHIPGCQVIATDISSEALEVASGNAAEQGVEDRIEFREGDLLAPLAGEKLRYLVSNPPYIPDDEWEEVEANVKDYEPVGALRGGRDGLDLIRQIIEQAHDYLDSPGQLVVEIASVQKDKVVKLCDEAVGLENAQVLADHERLPRVLVADI